MVRKINESEQKKIMRRSKRGEATNVPVFAAKCWARVNIQSLSLSFSSDSRQIQF